MWNRHNRQPPLPEQKQVGTVKPSKDKKLSNENQDKKPSNENQDKKLSNENKDEKLAGQNKDSSSETVRKRTKKVS